MQYILHYSSIMPNAQINEVVMTRREIGSHAASILARMALAASSNPAQL
jgi:hypothetical protein